MSKKTTEPEIKFDSRNYRIHDSRNKSLIRKSLEENGAGRSILLDRDGEIIAGNGVYEQAQNLGLKVKVIETDGTEIIAVKRTDLATQDAKRKRLAVLDNSASDSSRFDFEMLKEDFEVEELGEMGIEALDLEQFEHISPDEEDASADLDTVEEPEEKCLTCPNCGHTGSAETFTKTVSKLDIKKDIEFDIRPASGEEGDSVQFIYSSHGDNYCGFVMKPAIQTAIERGEMTVAVEQTGKIIGAMMWHKRKDGKTTLQDIAVRKDYRGNGVATKLLDTLPRPVSFKCMVNNPANKFYENYGAKLVGQESGRKTPLTIWELT